MWLSRGEMIDCLDGEVLVEPADKDALVRKIVWDSRQIEPGCAFLAIRGERVDGNTFIGKAVEDGAAFVVATANPGEDALEKCRKADAAVVLVSDHIAAMSQLAARNRDKVDANVKVVGITGSSGKTTTKNLIRDVLSAEFKTVATQANQNNELGVPNTVLGADENTQMLVVEMGMRGFHQLDKLCEFVKPTIGVVTNIGTAHEELLGSQENIAKAKSEMIAALPDGTGIAVLNGDDPFTPKIREFASVDSRGVRVITYGVGDGNAVHAMNIDYDRIGRPSFDIEFPDGRVSHVDLALMGAHNVMNACAAAAVGYVCDMPIERICNALGSAEGQSMRQEVVTARNGATVINDTYNANPDSMAAALSLLHMIECDGKRIAVLGDMGELGNREVEAHEKVGKLAHERGVDLLICVGSLARNIAAGAMSAGMPQDKVVECQDVAAAKEVLDSALEPHDVVLVKASRFMELEKLVKGLVD